MASSTSLLGPQPPFGAACSLSYWFELPQFFLSSNVPGDLPRAVVASVPHPMALKTPRLLMELPGLRVRLPRLPGLLVRLPWLPGLLVKLPRLPVTLPRLPSRPTQPQPPHEPTI